MQYQNKPNQQRPQAGADAGVRVRTLVLVSFFLIFGFGLLIYQLYALQVRDRTQYSADAAEQQLSDQTIPAERGSIYDSTGKLLAKSTVVWNLTADPSKCKEEYLSTASERISALLGGSVTAESLRKKLTATSEKTGEKLQYIVLARSLDMPTVQSVLDYIAEVNAEAESTVLSMAKEEAATRDYPYGAFLSGVLGFCNSDGAGFYGLEKSYEEVLAGTPGRVITTQNAFGYELANDQADTHDAINGNNLNLSIDVNIQGIVEDYLSKAVEDYNVQNRACAIVMNVNTGAILAMATTPQYDPNTPYSIYDTTLSDILENRILDQGTVATLENRLGKKAVADIVADGKIDDDEYSTLQGMMREAQWKNKLITELYYPGSVFKLVTASAALDSGVMDANQNFYCGGELTVAENTDWAVTYHCAAADTTSITSVHGMQDLSMALNNSCNLYFIQAGQTLGTQLFFDYFSAFGFTGTTGVDLPSETPWMSYYDVDELGVSELASSSFGQAQKITPLQMATAVAAVVNGGYLVTPHVVEAITDPNGNTVRTIDTTTKRQVISEDVSAQMRTMMENVVGEGADGHSGRNAYVAGYRIGGKSGTSEQLDQDKRWDDDYRKCSSFTAVLPIDDPEIEVFVMLDDPRWNNDYASQIVAPIVGNIISEVAPYLGLERDASYVAGADAQVPQCVGSAWTGAQVTLNKAGFNHKIVGSSTGSILYQYPYAGTSAPTGSTIYLYTESSEDTMVTVPDVTGKTGTFAAQMLSAAGLNASFAGDGSGRVTAQDIAAETSVPMGTVVTVTTGAPAAEQPAQNAQADSEPQQDEQAG